MSRSRLVRRVISCSVASALAATALSFGGGCRSNDPAEAEMPKAKYEALMAADAKISQGEREAKEGMDLRAAGKDGDTLIKQGEMDKADGQAMKDRAMMMR